MSLGWTSPCPPAAAAPPGGDAPSSPHQAAAVAFGNRCGHVPSAPRFHLLNLPEDANPARPAVISQAMAQLERYYATSHEARWDPLSQGERQRRRARKMAEVSDPPPGDGGKAADRRDDWRQQRSERREAVTSVLMLLLAYTDIATLTVAIPQGHNWLGLSIAWIAERTGLSASRVKRALATLTHARLLTATGGGRRFDRRQRRWMGIGWGPVRRLSFEVIRLIGLEVSWDSARRRQRKQQRPPPPPPDPPPPARSPAAQREQAQALRQALQPRRGDAPDPAARQAEIARTHRIAELAAEGLSPAEIRQRLNHTPQPP